MPQHEHKWEPPAVVGQTLADGRGQPRTDMVNHPPHYKVGGVETIDFIEAKELNFCLGNVVKYVARAAHKHDALLDLKKARWYLDREIASLERQ